MTDQNTGWDMSKLPSSVLAHGTAWYDSKAGVKRVHCKYHESWHERHEAKPECELDGVLGTLP